MIRAFAKTRWFSNFADREQLERFQARAIRRFLADLGANIPFYASFQGKDLPDLPVMSKAMVREHFARLNRYTFSLEMAEDLALSGERSRDFSATLPHGVAVGLSSGTSGSRGVFLVSPAERIRWAGTIIAKALSAELCGQLLSPFAPPLRVMLLLRSSNRLYAATASRRLRFCYGDLTRPLDELVGQLNETRPDLLVAPPSVLCELAKQAGSGALGICPRQVISAAEVLEDDDRALITAAWGMPPGEIYQCTEGFLACTCEHGRLHLNEELLHFEPEWLDAQKTRFTPLITDFTRRTQAFVRYRLDDVLVLDPADCPCGRVTRVLRCVEGRQDDVLWLHSAQGNDAPKPIFPDLVRRAFMLTVREGGDYRLRQSGNCWRISFEHDAQARAAWPSLQAQLSETVRSNNCRPPAFVLEAWTPPLLSEKRRRIQCLNLAIDEKGP